jgi:hypothetical protein
MAVSMAGFCVPALQAADANVKMLVKSARCNVIA